MRKPTLGDYRLYFVTDPRLHKGYSVLEQVELALRGGVKIIQIREKELPLPEFIKLASEALKLTRAHDAFLIINDIVEAVNSVGADGLHLGVATICRSTRLPVVGIGGINLGNCCSVIEAGAHGIAVVTAITMSDDIPDTCQTFLELMRNKEWKQI